MINLARSGSQSVLYLCGILAYNLWCLQQSLSFSLQSPQPTLLVSSIFFSVQRRLSSKTHQISFNRFIHFMFHSISRLSSGLAFLAAVPSLSADLVIELHLTLPFSWYHSLLRLRSEKLTGPLNLFSIRL